MDQFFEIMKSNKEWLFSGLGIAILSVGYNIVRYFLRKEDSKAEPNQTQNATQTQSVTINIPKERTDCDRYGIKNNQCSNITIEGMRAQTHILFIDDDKEFKIDKILKNAGWKNTSFFPTADVKDTSADKIKNAHIIFVDIKGVGKTMYKEEEGLGLVRDLKIKYPEKKIIIYSAVSEHNIYHEAIKLADDHIPKNSQPAEFVSAIEHFAEEIWRNA